MTSFTFSSSELDIDGDTEWIHADPGVLPARQTKTFDRLFGTLESALQYASDDVPAVLDEITEDNALKLSGGMLSPTYLVRASNGLLEHRECGADSAALDFDGWFRVIYQSHGVYVRWVDTAVSTDSDREYEFVDRGEISETSVVNSIAGSMRETPIACGSCEETVFDSVHEHARHVWDEHSVAHSLSRYSAKPVTASSARREQSTECEPTGGDASPSTTLTDF